MKRPVHIGPVANIAARRIYVVFDVVAITRIIDGIGERFSCNDTAGLDCNDVPARGAQIEGFDLGLA